jgi:hypothetical protein
MYAPSPLECTTPRHHSSNECKARKANTDGRVARWQQRRLENNCLIEVGGLRFLFQVRVCLG